MREVSLLVELTHAWVLPEIAQLDRDRQRRSSESASPLLCRTAARGRPTPVRCNLEHRAQAGRLFNRMS
uniref:Uncharacterized protein n=1 Tax=Denticeps clupeoides TaxID=299321 RepID=A0AAY4DS64_9TELE